MIFDINNTNGRTISIAISVIDSAVTPRLTFERRQHNSPIKELIDNINKYLEKNKVKLGMGLKNIESRVYSLHGECNIDSNLNQGTTVTIDIPLKNKVIK